MRLNERQYTLVVKEIVTEHLLYRFPLSTWLWTRTVTSTSHFGDRFPFLRFIVWASKYGALKVRLKGLRALCASTKARSERTRFFTDSD